MPLEGFLYQRFGLDHWPTPRSWSALMASPNSPFGGQLGDCGQNWSEQIFGGKISGANHHTVTHFLMRKKTRHAAFFETPLMRSIGCWDFCQANWALPKTFVEDPAGNIARRLMSDIRYLFFSSEVDLSLNNTEYNRRIFTATVLEQSLKKSHFLTRIDDPASAQGWKKKNAYLDILHDHCNLV